jgi:hypothetical protein
MAAEYHRQRQLQHGGGGQAGFSFAQPCTNRTLMSNACDTVRQWLRKSKR